MLCSLYPPTDAAGISHLADPQAANEKQLITTRMNGNEVVFMLTEIAAGLSEVIADPARVLTAPAVLDRLSHDFYWYSPVLRPVLARKTGDVAVQPMSADEVLAVLRYAGKHNVP